MKLINKTKENGFIKLEVQFVDPIWGSTVSKEVKAANSQLDIKGFRKGNVPEHIAKNYIRMPMIWDNAGRRLVEENWDDLVKFLEGTKIISEVQDLKVTATAASATIEITFMMFPEVKLPDFKKLAIKRDEVKVSQKDFDHEWENFEKHFKKVKHNFEKKIVSGDEAVIDFEGYIDGKLFDGGSGDNFDLVIGSGQFIPGFEEQLIGKNTGDMVDVNVKFPDDYHSEEYAGKPALFKVAIKSVKETEDLPAKEKEERLKMFGIASFEEAKQQINDSLLDQKNKQANNIFLRKIILAVDADKNSVIETPETLIKQEIKLLVKQTESQMERQGQKMDQYLKVNKLDMPALEKQFREPAIERIKSTLIISTIAEDQKIVVTEKELEARIEEIAKDNGATPEMVKQYMNVDNIEYGLKESKVLDYMASLAK